MSVCVCIYTCIYIHSVFLSRTNKVLLRTSELMFAEMPVGNIPPKAQDWSIS